MLLSQSISISKSEKITKQQSKKEHFPIKSLYSNHNLRYYTHIIETISVVPHIKYRINQLNQDLR